MAVKLSDWANVAEVVSGFAVVITLIFLILSIRENTEITRAAAYDRSIESLDELRREIAGDPDLVLVYQAIQTERPDLLDELGMVRARLIMNSVFNSFEKAYFANQSGLLGVAEWSRLEKGMCVQYRHANAFPEIPAALRLVISDEFSRHLEDNCVGDE
jgi:hypothetical protein